MNHIDPSTIQLKRLMQGGMSLEDACQALDLDIDAAKLVLSGDMGKELDADEIIRKHKARCVQALVNIGLDETLENASARVAALRVIVEGVGTIPVLPVDKLSAMYKQMKNVVEEGEKNVTVTTPSPATQIITVKGGEKKEVLCPLK